jgi:HTH-type transcriptional regulator/antitoxin HipB
MAWGAVELEPEVEEWLLSPSARWSAVCEKGTRRRTEQMSRRRAWSELRAERLSRPDARQAYWAAMRAFHIGEEVRRLRTQRGLSQQELAERMGVAQSVVARLEAGGVEPRLSTLDRVAQALGVELEVHFQSGPTGGRAVS